MVFSRRRPLLATGVDSETGCLQSCEDGLEVSKVLLVVCSGDDDVVDDALCFRQSAEDDVNSSLPDGGYRCDAERKTVERKIPRCVFKVSIGFDSSVISIWV